MRFLTVREVLLLHHMLLDQSGGLQGLRDRNALESAVGQPRMTFHGVDLYPTLIDKAAALGFSLIQNHPFVDGNKRAGHAAMELLLLLNGREIQCALDEQEAVVLRVASGQMDRASFTDWVRSVVIPLQD